MFCGKCGTKGEVGSNFCDQCGARLEIPHHEGSQQNLEREEPFEYNDYSQGFGPVGGDDTEIIDQEMMAEYPEFSSYHESIENVRPPTGYREPTGYRGLVGYREPTGYREPMGHKETIDGPEDYQGAYDDSSPEEGEKKKNQKPLMIILGILLLIAITATGWLFMGFQNTRAFNDSMDLAHRYLLAEDFEQAEAYFLRAIEVNPREVEPYLRLSDIYMDWDEPERAVDILEQGMEAVPEEEREIIENILDEIYEETGVGSTSLDNENNDNNENNGSEDVAEVTDPAPSVDPEDLELVYQALIAFHEFLSNPQTMMFMPWETGNPLQLSWNMNTIRHAELIDLRGDGIPQLLIVPPYLEELFWGNPFIIFEYTGQVEVLYQSMHWSEGGQWDLYDVAFRSDGKTFLVENSGAAGVPSGEDSTYFTLENDEFTPMLVTRRYWSSEEIDGEWRPVIESVYVNRQPVSEADFEAAPYEYLGIVESRRFVPANTELMDIQPLLRYIEERVAEAGYLGLMREEEYTWQERYIQFLMDYPIVDGTPDGRYYRLLFIDDSGIPQLLINSGAEWSNSRLVSYYEGQLYNVGFQFNSFYYIAEENNFVMMRGNDNIELVDVGMFLEGRMHFYNRGTARRNHGEGGRTYDWSSENFLTRQEYLRIIEEDPDFNIGKFWWSLVNPVEISGAEYSRRIDRAIDFSRASGGANMEFFTLDEIIEQINSL